ncbi:PREDICTED: uncharacterized protein C18orf8-like [Priapulus caudatus]|uniref:Uncharacterized protein C18orf8-like n=1 Tax=Priapulus caudatus TaxID=37621 RepID=A0ABM1EHT9_PRICU|nr:PREDICTED: uncharacterized protein C18orf8-like [Priapulus caudatus]
MTFRMEDKGKIESIKFSPDLRVLAVQRSQTTVEFINFIEGMDVMEYSQACKGKSTRILGFNWTGLNEIVFVTDHGLELYQVLPEKRTLKPIKTHNTVVNWLSACLIATYKTYKYGQLYVVVLRHQPRVGGQPNAEVCLYQLHRESPARKTDVLRLEMSGRFAVNVVDSLLVVHHQTSQTSMVFDIRLAKDSDGYVNYHHPVCPPLSIKSFTFQLPIAPTHLPNETTETQCDLYSSNWVVFQPNIVIDAKWGCLWTVQLNLQPMINMFPDKLKLMDFLLQRSDSKMTVLTVCLLALSPGPQQCGLRTISQLYDKLNAIYKDHLDSKSQGAEAVAPSTSQVVVDQSDMYTYVLSRFVDSIDASGNYKFVVAVLIDYIRSLNQNRIHVQHYLYELLINTLVQNGCFYQLHQMMQYHVLSDSKHLACLLLSLESVYPPAHQLALDMLKRLSTANEEIIEVLLSTHQLFSALRFVKTVGQVDQISARKFLEVALSTENNQLFYTVFKFFEQRNLRLRGRPDFPKGEHCESYVKHFESLYGSEALGQPLQT